MPKLLGSASPPPPLPAARREEAGRAGGGPGRGPPARLRAGRDPPGASDRRLPRRPRRLGRGVPRTRQELPASRLHRRVLSLRPGRSDQRRKGASRLHRICRTSREASRHEKFKTGKSFLLLVPSRNFCLSPGPPGQGWHIRVYTHTRMCIYTPYIRRRPETPGYTRVYTSRLRQILDKNENALQ